MRVKIEGEIRVFADNCTAHEMGIETGRMLLAPVVDPMRAQNVPKGAMQDLLLGLLAGAVGHFARDLSIDEIHEQLDNCKRMVSEVPGFLATAQMNAAGKAVH